MEAISRVRKVKSKIKHGIENVIEKSKAKITDVKGEKGDEKKSKQPSEGDGKQEDWNG